MKKIFLLIVWIIGCDTAYAQPWIPNDNTHPLKFMDVVKNYVRSDEKDEKQEQAMDGKVIREGKDMLFDRWFWYWSQHLDGQGNMVPPIVATKEWLQYMPTQNKAGRTTSSHADWSFQGPDHTPGGYSGLGRINTVAFDPVDSNTMYVGSAAGSTWKTTDGGANWHPLYDNLPTLGVADIKINPLNRNTIFVATGDGDGNDTYSSGILKSYDGGNTWNTTGLNWLPSYYLWARSLIINPLDTNSLMLGTNYGIYKTQNGGTTWINIPVGNFKQLLYNPIDTHIVYGTIYTDAAAQIVRSKDGGRTWDTVTNFTDANRVCLAVCPANPAIVKAIVSNNANGLQGIYNSSDTGATYTPLFTDDTSCSHNLLCWDFGLPTTACDGQGWYDLCIAMDPSNPAEVTVGGVNTYHSSNGGSTWQIANQWYSSIPGLETVHADKHCLAYNKLTGALFETCDGGVYKNYGPLTAPWIDLTNGIGITEFYRNAVDNGVSFCLGGAQDNGTKSIEAGVAADMMGGDGMQPLINYADPSNIFYCSSQYGYVAKTEDGGVSFNSITSSLPDTKIWITPYALHPHDWATLLLGYRQVYVTYDNGSSWSDFSPLVDTNYYDYITNITIAPSNPNYVYVLQNDYYTTYKSVIRFTANNGATWDTISSPFAAYTFATDLVVDPKNEKRFWVTIGGYQGFTKVFSYDLTTNSWSNESGTLPNLPVKCMVIDSLSGTKYIGTDAAVYYKTDSMTNWALYNTHLPTVHISDLNINYTTGELWAATYGRGMWKSLKNELPNNVVIHSPADYTIGVSPNPSHGTFTVSSSGQALKNTAASVKLLSADGKAVWQTKTTFDTNGKLKVATEGISPGFYICEVSTDNRVSRSKIVIY